MNNTIMVPLFFKLPAVLPSDNAASLANRIHTLEHLHYPPIIEKEILSQAD